ncbi:MAG: HlyD family type I secretion periplasmic adaptor subunit [Magnetococcales bacterium]|nr:HlyD family type I secretion periplasmic adaptor subunit [Magnetococcales bacterium]
MGEHWQESDFYPEGVAARQRRLHPASHLLLLMILLFFVFFIVWAWLANLDEVTVGNGRVIPSGQVQVVQNLEGGIVAEILAKEGNVVQKGDILLRIDDTQFRSTYRENHARYLALTARIARLTAETNGETDFVVPTEVTHEQASLAASEKELFVGRKRALESSLSVLRSQIEQKEQEIVELTASKKQIDRRLAMVRKELAITDPMVKQGVMSQVELLRLQREAAELEASLESATLALPRIRAALEEVRSKSNEPLLEFRKQALNDLNTAKAELSGLKESITPMADRVTRTAVRSPVKGTVLQIKVSTVGQVVRPGVDLMEIMPLEDSLLVEARIRPADIGFLHPGQKTMVKFTAYDYSIYGGLEGELVHISADTIVDDSGERNERGEHFYRIQVRTKKNHLGTEAHPLPIIPGMVTVVDIMTGKKSVLDYIMKPILKAKANALRER